VKAADGVQPRPDLQDGFQLKVMEAMEEVVVDAIAC
jgi:hypothetical protein